MLTMGEIQFAIEMILLRISEWERKKVKSRVK